MANTVSRFIPDTTFNRIIQIESGGRVRCKAPTSSALGLFQFLNGTWLATVQKHRPDLLKGNTRAEVLALRTDAHVCIEIGARFTEDNAHALGEGFSDGDLYLAHFLGIGTAKKFLHAAPSARAEELAGPEAVKANPTILKDKTASQVRSWAQHAMTSRWVNAGKVDWVAKYYHAEPHPDDVPAPVKPETESGHIDDPHAEPPPPPAPKPKTGITETAQATAGLSVLGIFGTIWDKLKETPESVLNALVAAAQRPTFWVFVAIAVAVAFVWFERHKMKKADA
jgi:hypothetical protein